MFLSKNLKSLFLLSRKIFLLLNKLIHLPFQKIHALICFLLCSKPIRLGLVGAISRLKYEVYSIQNLIAQKS